MTREEAILKLQQGFKITHQYFTNDEFVYQPNPRISIYKFEDGAEQNAKDFWDLRVDVFWNYGWEIFNNQTTNQ